MLTFAIKKKRTPSIAPKRHAPTVSPMSHSLHLQQEKVRHILRSSTLQPKLTIGAPNDKYEQEADRVADEVMRMPEQRSQRQAEEEEEELIQTKPLAEQITPLVQRQMEEEEEEEEEEPIQAKPAGDIQLQRQEAEPEEEEEMLQAKPLTEQIAPLVQRQVEPEEEEEEPIQTKQVSTHTPAVTPNLASRIQSLRGGGQPLPKSARSFFEPRFGYDFSHVRVHSDAKAAESAWGLNAKAFTIGRDIVFGAGHYAQGTTEGKKLLAHELMHVVQQNNGSKASSMFQNSKNLIQRSKASNDILKILFWPLSLLISLLNKGVKAVVYLYNYIKNKSPWMKKAVSFLLCITAIGKATVGILKKHPVYRFKSHSLKRQYYKDPAMTIKKGGVKILKALGYFDPNTGGIAIKSGLTNAQSASTLVHEATHAKQWEQYKANRRKFDLAKWEYDAHIKEEKYKIVMDIPPKHPSFRKKKRVKGKWIWVVHKRGIIKWVDKKYGIKQHHRDWDEKVVGKKGPIGPWKCPG